MPSTDIDRNLLFGVVALQRDMIDQPQFAEACSVWALAIDRPLADVLIERGWITNEDRSDIERDIERKLRKHRGDVRATLGAVAGADARDAIRAVDHPEVRKSLSGLPPALGHVLIETLAPPNRQEGSRYTLTRLHAEGGLGKVWVARDGDLNREVALKEIRPEGAAHAESWRRFLKEAQITGQLEHPNIVPVYELARRKEDDQPFYTMKFVHGQTLRQAIAKFHQDGGPADRLELQKLLAVFINICQAVGYAHSRGVVHRDLKPENVVMGGFGEVIVLDWGLAKMVDEPEQDEEADKASRVAISAEAVTTPTIGTVGTPEYMAPEQVEGRHDLIDGRTDVYGLGGILFEILTGRPPAIGETVTEIYSKILAGSIPRARDLVPTVSRPLDAICARALARDRAGRYARATDLAEDVRRWVADEPVTAYPEPFTRRASRWAKKHRTSLTTASSAALVAALLTGGFAWQRFEHRRRTDDAGRTILAKAEGLAIQARTSGELPTWDKAVAETLLACERLDSGDGSPALRLEAENRLKAFRADQGRRAEALAAEARDNQVVIALEAARLQGANIKDGNFDTQAMIDAYLSAFRAYGIDVATLPVEDVAWRIRSSAVADELIATLDDWLRYGAKNISRERLAAIARAAETDSVRVTIREAVSRHDAASLRRFCESENDRLKLGPRIRFIFASLSHLDPVGSFPLLETILRENPSDFWLNHDLGRAYSKTNPPRLVEAAHYYSIAVALRPDSPGVHLNLGFALQAQGQLDQAIAEYRASIRIKPDYTEAHFNLGVALKAQGQLDQAIAEYRAAIRIKPDYAEAHLNLGVDLSDQGQLDQAIAEYRAAIHIKPDFAEARSNLGNALSDQGQFDQAIAEFRAAIRIKPDYAEAHLNLGITLSDQGQLDQAIAEYRAAVRIKPDYAEAHYNLGIAMKDQGQLDQAITSFRVTILLKPDDAEAHCNLGSALLQMGRFGEALESLEKGHALGSKQPGWRYPSEAWVRDARRLTDFEAKLSLISKGEAIPKDSAERLELADLCYKTRRYATSARFLGEAFAETPALAKDLEKGNRYFAARSASLAASGRGRDEPMPNDQVKAKLREQALGWLRDELAALGTILDGGTESGRKQAVAGKLAHWMENADLAGIRDEGALAKLPEEEREGFRVLWKDVEALRKKASGGQPE